MACSGDMYSGVPEIVPLVVMVASSSAWTTPKSVISARSVPNLATTVSHNLFLKVNVSHFSNRKMNLFFLALTSIQSIALVFLKSKFDII